MRLKIPHPIDSSIQIKKITKKNNHLKSRWFVFNFYKILHNATAMANVLQPLRELTHKHVQSFVQRLRYVLIVP